MSWLRLSFESCLSEIYLVSTIVKGVCGRIGLDPVAAYELELCAVEGVTNAIRHAYHQQAGNEVTVLFRFDDQQIELEIQDWGESMCPEALHKLMHGSNVFNFDPSDLPSVPESGMGLQLIHQLTDTRRYSSDAGFNRLIVTRQLAR